MNIRFVDPGRQYLAHREEYINAIDDVLKRGDLIMRDDVENFEKSIAALVGTKQAIAVNSGTDTMFLALKALGIGEGDEVITVSHTFVASMAVIVQAGATPILVDVREDFLVDPDLIEAAITEKTKAILPVHLNGRVCDMEKIMEIAEKHNLLVIEDAAQALSAEFQGKKAGSFGVAGSFSLYPFKVLGSFGDGGILTTNDDKLAEQVRLLRDHGQKTKTEIVMFGWNSRLDNMQAAVLNVKLKYLDEWIERRREIAAMYNKALENVSGVVIPPQQDEDHKDIYQNYVLKVEKRNELAAFLKEHGVETLIKDPVANHKQPGLKLEHFSLPVTEQLADSVISLPLYPELTNEEVEYAGELVRKFYES